MIAISRGQCARGYPHCFTLNTLLACAPSCRLLSMPSSGKASFSFSRRTSTGTRDHSGESDHAKLHRLELEVVKLRGDNQVLRLQLDHAQLEPRESRKRLRYGSEDRQISAANSTSVGSRVKRRRASMMVDTDQEASPTCPLFIFSFVFPTPDALLS